MEINLTDTVKEILMAFFLLILPWLVILLGLFLGIENAMYFILCITWFGTGIVFFGALKS